MCVCVCVLYRYYYYSEDTADPEGPKSYEVHCVVYVCKKLALGGRYNTLIQELTT